eukprot:scaffold96066_cov68-Phaeocystis_antarctica.AAC.2
MDGEYRRGSGCRLRLGFGLGLGLGFGLEQLLLPTRRARPDGRRRRVVVRAPCQHIRIGLLLPRTLKVAPRFCGRPQEHVVGDSEAVGACAALLQARQRVAGDVR